MFLSLPRVLVLMYHHVSNKSGAYTVSPSLFEEQLQHLINSGYSFLSLQQYADITKNPKIIEPGARLCLLTFDDGWIDNWIHVFPILKRLDIPATFFVVSGWIGQGEPRNDLLELNDGCLPHEEAVTLVASSDQSSRDCALMRWSELRYIAQNSKIDIADHSYQHGEWWKNTAEQALIAGFAKDCVSSQSEFKREMGRESPYYCWPRGEFSPLLIEAARSAGYLFQFSTIRGINVLNSGTVRLIRRINVENKGIAWFRRMVMLYSFYLFPELISRIHLVLSGLRLSRKYSSLPKCFFKYSLFDKI